MMRIFFKRLHQDECGDAIQTILIVAAIAVPLLVALIAFGTDIVGYKSNQAEKIAEDKSKKISEAFKPSLATK